MARPSKGLDAFSARAFVRMTPAQYDRFLSLGGSKWLRGQIDAAEGRQRLTPTPTAHNPFPGAPAKPGEVFILSINGKPFKPRARKP